MTEQGMKIVLAVDDRPEILASVNAALNGHYKVFGLTSGKAALKFLEKYEPDLFMLDIEMPDMDGFEIADIIKADAKFADTPIIFLTGHTSREYVFRALTSGIEDFIIKPSTHDAILSKVDKYLK
jgi:PleD family two-component response regulator